MKKTSAGIVTITPAAMMRPQSTTAMWKNSLMPMASVLSSSWPISTSAKRKSFQATMNVKIAVAMMPGSARGITTYAIACARLAPSISAACSSSSGIDWKNARRIHSAYGSENEISFSLPYALWILRAFFQSIPLELEHAALIDGANRAQAMAYVVMPLALPGIIATAIFTFIVAWNDF